MWTSYYYAFYYLTLVFHNYVIVSLDHWHCVNVLFDIGVSYVSSCQADIMQLLNDLKMSTYPQYTTGSKIMQLTDTERTSTYTSEIPSLPFLALIDLFFFMRRVIIISVDHNLSICF